MESPKSIESSLDELATLSPNGAEYLTLLLEELEIFNLEEYHDRPEQAQHSLPNLEDDQAELINEIRISIKSETDRETLQDILRRIVASLASKQVTLWALHPVFKHFGVLIEDDSGDGPNQEHPIRFHMPNLLFDRKQLDGFYRACGLTEDKKSGKGSHTLWRDENGTYIATSSESRKKWLKNNIKESLAKGLPIKSIQMACDSLGIDFTVIED